MPPECAVATKSSTVRSCQARSSVKHTSTSVAPPLESLELDSLVKVQIPNPWHHKAFFDRYWRASLAYFTNRLSFTSHQVSIWSHLYYRRSHGFVALDWSKDRPWLTCFVSWPFELALLCASPSFIPSPSLRFDVMPSSLLMHELRHP